MFKTSVVAFLCLIIPAGLLPASTLSFAPKAADDKIIGRWDMVVQDASGATYPSWFEATREGDKLAGRFVWTSRQSAAHQVYRVCHWPSQVQPADSV